MKNLYTVQMYKNKEKAVLDVENDYTLSGMTSVREDWTTVNIVCETMNQALEYAQQHYVEWNIQSVTTSNVPPVVL